MTFHELQKLTLGMLEVQRAQQETTTKMITALEKMNIGFEAINTALREITEKQDALIGIVDSLIRGHGNV